MAQDTLEMNVNTPKARIAASIAILRLLTIAARVGLPVPSEDQLGWLRRWVLRGVRVSVI